MRVLKEILADGPLAAGNVKMQAKTAGVAERTLDRARQALGVVPQRKGFGPGAHYEWSMPAMPDPPLADGEHGEHGMHAMGAMVATVEHDGEYAELPYPTTTEGDR